MLQAEQRREMHEALRVRKEALEQALAIKTAELMAICIREAVSERMENRFGSGSPLI